MADNISTPVADATVLAAKDIGGIKFPQNLIVDPTGVDAIGQVGAAPAANSLLGRLKTIADLLTLTNGYVDQLEGYFDGVEGLLAAPTPAGEAYIGKMGGDVLTAAAAAPAVSTTAYAAGNVVGGLLTFTGAARTAAGAGLIQAATVLSKSAQTAALDLLIFSDNPTATTFTDKAAVSIAATDMGKLVGVIHLTDWTALGNASIAQAVAAGLPFKLATGTSLYGVLVTRAAMTLASTSDLTLSLRIIPG